MEANTIIAKNYRIVKPLFQVNSYLYAQLCSIKTYEVLTAALYLYENEDPSQPLKMLMEKLDIENRHYELNYLIFPTEHIKEVYSEKNLSIFFIKDYLVPLSRYEKKTFSTQQFLQILHGALNCLNQLHSREIVHGNISLNTSYLLQQKKDARCRFSLNILDSSYLVDENCNSDLQELLYKSQGQSLGLKASFKDDLECLVYVLTNLISKGRLFTVQRFQLQWVTQAEFLRWKTCEFFKEMINIVPPELQIMIQIYTIAKSLRRNQKPDYLKLIKKVLDLMLKCKRSGLKLAEGESKQTKVKKQVTISREIDQRDIEIRFNETQLQGQGHGKHQAKAVVTSR